MGEMAQMLRAHAGLAEDPDSISSGAQPTVTQVPGDLMPSSCIGRHQV